MKTFKILIVLTLMISVFSCTTKTKSGITVVSTEEMETLIDIDNVQLVDVRTPNEYKLGHIEHSQNIDFYSPTFEADIIKLDKQKPVILYCKSGKRSAKCAEKMLEAGFEKIYDLKGGFTEWQHMDVKIKM